jgi:hypothetical protein
MADCSNLFIVFNGDLFITATKKERLIKSWHALRDKIIAYLKENYPDYTAEFFIQGSYKCGTMIRTKEDECDLDLGVFFPHDIDVTANTLQEWVKNAVDEASTTPPTHKKKCIRVIYKQDYHIDLPVFKKSADSDGNPMLAVKDNGFQDDDPKEFVNWFNENKSDQLLRIVRYLKAWCDHKRATMPSGLAMTILAVNNYSADDRDDLAVLATLKKIRETLEDSFECVMPTTPYDDLFEGMSQTSEEAFLSAMDSLIADGDRAIENTLQTEAAKKWKNHFGTWFPASKAKDEEAAQVPAAVKINQSAKSA